MRIMRRMGKRHIIENSPAQQAYKMYNFVICCSTRTSRTVDFGACPRRAKTTTSKTIFENGRLSGLLCWPHGQDIENSPAQRHSKFSKSLQKSSLHFLHDLHGEEMYSAQRDSRMTNPVMGVMGIIGLMGRMRQKHIIKNSPAQRDSKNSKSGFPVNNSSVQPDSKNSKFKKNQTLHSLHDFHGEEMYSAQPHSKNSKRGMGLLRGLRNLGILRQKNGMKKHLLNRTLNSPNWAIVR